MNAKDRSIYQKIKLGWISFETYFTNIILLLLVGLVFMEVILRAFGSPTTWSVGVAQLFFIWVTFLGANQALRKKAHVGIDALTQLVNKKVRVAIEILMSTLIVLFLIYLLYFGTEMVTSNTGRIISGTSIRYSFITLSIPVGSLLMLVTASGQMLAKVKEIKN
ncbi:TRAP transporter small permease [Gracilibacillus sp. HCP3S3_G5_1]|uniref:TRAP transporter small permease n=1 Tax=unclassified Gracilibacillus TaxID=2625209 RepID=UPI003F8A875A